MSHEVTLRPGDAGHSSALTPVVRDSRGRFYEADAYDPGTIMVFGPDGQFLTKIGRYGRGPGEYQMVSSLFVSPGDSLHVFDQPNRTHTVLTPSYEIARATVIGAFPWDAVQVAPGQLIVAANIPSRASFGYPLHMLEGRSITRPLGPQQAIELRTPRQNPVAMVRYLAPGPQGHFWAVHFGAYLIDLISFEGRLVKRFSADPEWFVTSDPTTPESRLNARLQDVEWDPETGLVWLAFTVRDLKWRERSRVDNESWPGRPRIQSTTGSNFDLHDTMIEVFDPVAGEILASLRVDPYIRSFAGPGRLAVYHESEAGIGEFQIHRVTLNRPSTQR